MARVAKSKQRAIEFANDLMEVLNQMDGMTKREAAAAARLLRAGCAATVNNGNAEWEDALCSYPDLDTGEALLAVSNRLAWLADERCFSLEDIYKEFP